MLTLLEVDDEGWTERELPTPSRGFSTDFATGSFDTVPGMDLLVTDDEDALLVRSFATDPTAAHEPVVYVPAEETPDARILISEPAWSIVGDGIDSVSLNGCRA